MSARVPADASFLGTGWSFPPEFGEDGADVAVVSDAEDVHQALQVLLGTRRGERPLQEGFGCNLDSVLFEEMDHALVSRVSSLIQDAILVYEPRVNLRGVDVSRAAEAGVLEIRIDYEVRGINSRFNMVFPFYLNEATSPGL